MTAQDDKQRDAVLKRLLSMAPKPHKTKKKPKPKKKAKASSSKRGKPS